MDPLILCSVCGGYGEVNEGGIPGLCDKCNGTGYGEAMSPVVNDFNLVQFTYTNHKNKTGPRKVLPIRLWFGSTAWHPDPQWLLEAFDIDKQATRDFAMAGIVGWMRVERLVNPVE